MARIDWIETRLLNWARWRLTRGVGVLGYAGVNFMKAMAGHGTRIAEAPIPTNAIEAGETDDAVAKLPSELRATVWVHYLEESEVRRHNAPDLNGAGRHVGRADRKPRRLAKLQQRLDYLCCAESTYHTRLGRAHRALADHFTSRQERREREQRRVRAFIEGARP